MCVPVLPAPFQKRTAVIQPCVSVVNRVPTLMALASLFACVFGVDRSGKMVHGQVLVTPTDAGLASVFRLSSVARAWIVSAPVRGMEPV